MKHVIDSSFTSTIFTFNLSNQTELLANSNNPDLVVQISNMIIETVSDVQPYRRTMDTDYSMTKPAYGNVQIKYNSVERPVVDLNISVVYNSDDFVLLMLLHQFILKNRNLIPIFKIDIEFPNGMIDKYAGMSLRTLGEQTVNNGQISDQNFIFTGYYAGVK